MPHHTKEYLARQALNKKERVVQRASKAVSNKSHRQQVPLSNASSSVPTPAPKLPEVAYYDDFWKMPVGITQSHPPQPQELFLPFETLPGYGAPNAIQDFSQVARPPPSLTPLDFPINYSDFHGLQPYTMQSQEQQLGGLLTGNNQGMPPYNGNELWNWPLQNWPLGPLQ